MPPEGGPDLPGGPLAGVRVVELAGLAPLPFGATLLADLGADVVVVDRPQPRGPFESAARGPLRRSRRRVVLDLKEPAGVQGLLGLAGRADVLVEPYRPGVAERLGIGPDACLAANPRLVYARLTGWGQDGPAAQTAGHDITYAAVSGALEPIGRAGQRPHAPLNYLADFAGGGLLLALGVVAALYERERSGRGQVVDVAMVDGAALLTAFVHATGPLGLWSRPRGENLLDGGAPFYDTYACADGGFVAVGAIEPQFYAALLAGLGLAGPGAEPLPSQLDPAGWPALRARFAETFAGHPRAHWEAVFAGTDACVVPVLSPWEAPDHPHLAARGTFVEVDGERQPAPAPRFSRTPAPPPRPEPVGADAVDDVVAGWPR